MKSKIILALLSVTGIMAFSQRPTMELTYTAVNNTTRIPLDSIKVMNLTQDCDTVLYFPDTVLVLDYEMGIPEVNQTAGEFQVFQNYPNPMADQTTISLYIPDKDKVNIIVTDVLGRPILKYDQVLDQGTNSFRLIPGGGNLYFFNAQWREHCSSIKILQANSSRNAAISLEFIGNEVCNPLLKASEDIQIFSFNPGDRLLNIGFADTLETGLFDSPEASETYTFQYAANIPCPGIPTVEYEGQVYNTVQIFNQCWLKENLNVGEMISGTIEQSNNEIIEKYCYNNEPDSCSKYGGFYQWWEVMQYINPEGTQGICPPGWHVPLEEEWKVLEGAADSLYSIYDDIWNNYNSYRGFDAGINLRSTKGWYWFGDFNGPDLFGFSARPAGYCSYDGTFDNIGMFDGWWTSTEVNAGKAWYRCINMLSSKTGLYNYFGKEYGFSVRCIRDE